MWWLHFRRWGVPILLTLAAGALQTTAWYQLFGSLSAPPLWLLIIFWLSLYRITSFTILYIYGLGALASAFTGAPLKMMLVPLLILHILISFARQRVFWTGPLYFALVSVAGVSIYQVVFVGLSHLLEPNPATWLVLERVTQTLLSVPFSFLVYAAMSAWADPVPPESLMGSEAST